MNKYKAQRVGAYDSKKEAKRASILAMLERAGHIADLVHHPRYSLDVCGIHICDYEADFRYKDAMTGAEIVEDCKGFSTPVYKLKKKLMHAVHGITIKET